LPNGVPNIDGLARLRRAGWLLRGDERRLLLALHERGERLENRRRQPLAHALAPRRQQVIDAEATQRAVDRRAVLVADRRTQRQLAARLVVRVAERACAGAQTRRAAAYRRLSLLLPALASSGS
jgi:hypothetical protein